MTASKESSPLKVVSPRKDAMALDVGLVHASKVAAKMDPAVVTTCVAILFWYIFTGVSSIYLKLALHHSSPFWSTVIILFVSALLTGFLPGAMPQAPQPADSADDAAHHHARQGFLGQWRFYLLAGLLHGLNTLTLLHAFRQSGVALTYTIKAMEPLVNLILSKLRGLDVRLSWMAMAGLCTLPIGIFLSQQSKTLSTSGMLFACANVLLTSSRSVVLKGKLNNTNPLSVFFLTSAFGVVAVLPLGVFFFDEWSFSHLLDAQLLTGVLGFLGYNLCSFYVLSKVEAVFHGSLNVTKRLTTVIASIAILRPNLAPVQVLGIGLAFSSLMIYFATREGKAKGAHQKTGAGEESEPLKGDVEANLTGSLEHAVGGILVASALVLVLGAGLYISFAASPEGRLFGGALPGRALASGADASSTAVLQAAGDAAAAPLAASLRGAGAMQTPPAA